MGASTLIAIVIGSWIGVMGAVRLYGLFDTLAILGRERSLRRIDLAVARAETKTS